MSITGGVMVPHPPIILPEIGRGEEKKIKATSDAFKKAMSFAASLEPETLVIASPHPHLPGSGGEGGFPQFPCPRCRDPCGI